MPGEKGGGRGCGSLCSGTAGNWVVGRGEGWVCRWWVGVCLLWEEADVEKMSDVCEIDRGTFI